MKVKLISLLYILAATIVGLGAVLTRSAAAPTAQGPGAINDADVNGGLATLYAVDPISQTFCFADGQAGHVLQANEVRNRCSDIDFGNYSANSFSVGVEGGRLGAIVDLGTPSDLLQRYGFEEPVPSGQYFASLRIDNRKAVILKDRKLQSKQQLLESEQLFQEGKSSASAPVRLGHIYVLRITDRYDKTFQRMVKLIVIAHTPSQSVTFRWHLL